MEERGVDVRGWHSRLWLLESDIVSSFVAYIWKLLTSGGVLWWVCDVAGQHRGLWFHTIGQRKGIVYVCQRLTLLSLLCQRLTLLSLLFS